MAGSRQQTMPPQSAPPGTGASEHPHVQVSDDNAAGDNAPVEADDDAPVEEETAILEQNTVRWLGSFGFSLCVHLTLIVILASIFLTQHEVERILSIYNADNVAPHADAEESIELDMVELTTTLEQDPEPVIDPTIPAPEITTEIDQLALLPTVDDILETTADDALAAIKLQTGPLTRLSGRSEAARAALVRSGGGTPASEEAVELGLKWLATHQQPDGSWSFDHRTNDVSCLRECTEPGHISNCKTGATAMALLCFLGAGYGHTDGKYQEVVAGGLNFLMSVMRVNANGGNGGDVSGEAGYKSMYVQGLSAIALCEAYAMTKASKNQSKERSRRSAARDLKNGKGQSRKPVQVSRRTLGDAAQYAIDYIVWAQDPSGGGWRYWPREAGDTSVMGWQLMALQSARFGKLRMDRSVFKKASRFLDSAQADKGARYGYTGPDRNRASTTAVGLLCRMYLGWKREKKALERGVEYLSTIGPADDDMYYNYYATQVLHHWGGSHWSVWNTEMREQLVGSQLKKGHAAGSWDVRDEHGSSGGRLYMTALCIMTLEVYYRYMPLYDRSAIEDDP